MRIALILRRDCSYCSLLISISAVFARQIASKRREYVQSKIDPIGSFLLTCSGIASMLQAVATCLCRNSVYCHFTPQSKYRILMVSTCKPLKNMKAILSPSQATLSKHHHFCVGGADAWSGSKYVFFIYTSRGNGDARRMNREGGKKASKCTLFSHSPSLFHLCFKTEIL